MKIITLWQPWASLIALGLKQYETRTWSTSYRGKLLIHAAKRPDDVDEKQAIVDKLKGSEHYASMVKLFGTTDFPLGAIVAVADLADCEKILPSVIHTKPQLEQAVGNWEFYRYAWKLENINPLANPVPYKGGQGLRNVDLGFVHIIESATNKTGLAEF